MFVLNVERLSEHAQICPDPYCGRAFNLDGNAKVRFTATVALVRACLRLTLHCAPLLNDAP